MELAIKSNVVEVVSNSTDTGAKKGDTEMKAQESDSGGVAETNQTNSELQQKTAATVRFPVFIDGKILSITNMDVMNHTFCVRFQVNLQWEQIPQQPSNDREAPKLEILNFVSQALETETNETKTYKDIVMESLIKKQRPNHDALCEQHKYCDERWQHMEIKDKPHLYDYTVWNGEIYSIKGVESMDYNRMQRTETIYSLVLGQKFYLKNFPFDCQKLPIKMRFTDARYFAVPKYKPVDVNKLERGPIFLHAQRDQLLINDFRIVDFMCAIFRVKRGGELDDDEVDYDASEQITLDFSLMRNWSHYFWSYFVTNLTLSGLGFCSFFFYHDISLINGRLQLLFALVLTLVAEKFITGTALPKLPYNTLLDHYLNCSFAYIVLLCAMTSGLALIKYHSGVDQQWINDKYSTVNNYSFIVFAAMWIVYNIFFLMLCIYRRVQEIELKAAGIHQYYHVTAERGGCFTCCQTLRVCLGLFGCCIGSKCECCARCSRDCISCFFCDKCCRDKRTGTVIRCKGCCDKCSDAKLGCIKCCCIVPYVDEPRDDDESTHLWVGVAEICHTNEEKKSRGKDDFEPDYEDVHRKYDTLRVYKKGKIEICPQEMNYDAMLYKVYRKFIGNNL